MEKKHNVKESIRWDKKIWCKKININRFLNLCSKDYKFSWALDNDVKLSGVLWEMMNFSFSNLERFHRQALKSNLIDTDDTIHSFSFVERITLTENGEEEADN